MPGDREQKAGSHNERTELIAQVVQQEPPKFPRVRRYYVR